MYIKVIHSEGNVIQAEALPEPVYVYVQKSNGRILRCVPEKAQGILGADGAVIYQLPGKASIPGAAGTAEVITEAEYLELLVVQNQPEDPEDTSPEIPEEEPQQVFTRAELTRKVLELDEALDLLLSEVTE